MSGYSKSMLSCFKCGKRELMDIGQCYCGSCINSSSQNRARHIPEEQKIQSAYNPINSRLANQNPPSLFNNSPNSYVSSTQSRPYNQYSGSSRNSNPAYHINREPMYNEIPDSSYNYSNRTLPNRNAGGHENHLRTFEEHKAQHLNSNGNSRNFHNPNYTNSRNQHNEVRNNRISRNNSDELIGRGMNHYRQPQHANYYQHRNHDAQDFMDIDAEDPETFYEPSRPQRENRPDRQRPSRNGFFQFNDDMGLASSFQPFNEIFSNFFHGQGVRSNPFQNFFTSQNNPFSEFDNFFEGFFSSFQSRLPQNRPRQRRERNLLGLAFSQFRDLPSFDFTPVRAFFTHQGPSMDLQEILAYLSEMHPEGQRPANSARVNNLKLVKMTNEILKDHSTCTVCQEDFKLGEKAKRLSCDHYFHEECIMPWLQNQNTCPVCRKIV